jgi:penicillin-binding protein 1A
MPAPESGAVIVPALVTAVDDKLKGDQAEVVRLALGPGEETTLTLKDISWARTPDPGLDGAVARIQRPSEALKPGYLVWLEKVGESPSVAAGSGADAQKPVARYALYQEPRAEGALVAIDVNTGHVRAMVGGYSFERSQFNRALQSRRQPGSAFKPVIYAAALREGHTPASIVYDTPIVYEDKDRGLTWKPGNYSEKFYGPITLRSSLAHSRNVATIKVLRKIGIPPVLLMAEALGINRSLEANLSLALGASEVTPAELVRAYATFASGGRPVKPIFTLEIRDRDGVPLEENVPLLPSERELEPDGEPDHDTLERLLDEIRASVDREDDRDGLPPGYALDPVTAYLMTDLLRAVVQEGTGWRAKALGRPVAGKTGTTNDLFDAWFVGFTPQVVTGVWVGYDVAANLGKNETGSRAASPIFVDYMRRALRDLPPADFPVPNGIVFARIDRKSGLLAVPLDQKAVFQPFREGTVPDERAATDGTAGPVRPARLD